MSSIGNTLVVTGRNRQPATTPPPKNPVVEFHQEIEILTEDSIDCNVGSLSAVVDSSCDSIGEEKRPINQNSKLKQDDINNNTQLSCKLMPLQVSNEKLQYVPENLQTIQQEKVSKIYKEIEILAEVSQDSQSDVKSILPVENIQFDKQDRVSLVHSKTNVHPKISNNPNFTLNTRSINETQSEVHDLPGSQPTNSVEDSLSNMHIIEARIQEESTNCKATSGTKSSSLKDNPEHWFKLLDWQTGKRKYVCAHCNERFENKRDMLVHIQEHISFDSNRPKNGNDDSNCDSIIEIFSEENLNSLICENKSLQDLVPPRLDSQILDSDSVMKMLPKDSVDSTRDNLVCMTSCPPTEQVQFTNGNSKHSVSNISETHSDVPLNLVNLLSDSIVQKYLESHNRTKVFICAHCNERSTSKSRLRVHIKKHMSVEFTLCTCSNCNTVGSNKIRDSKGRPLHLCHISHCGRTFRQIKVLKRHLKLHLSEKKFFYAHCDENFESEDHLAKHVHAHMVLNHNDNGHVSECYTKRDTLAEVGTDDIIESMNRETQLVQDLPSPCLDFEVLECNRVIEALPDMKTECAESISNYKTNSSSVEQSQVDLQDLLLTPVIPSSLLRSNHSSVSETSSTCQTLPTLRSIYSVNNALRETCSADGSNKTKCPNGKLLYVCYIAGCEKVFNYPYNLKRHINLHSVKKNLRQTALCTCPNCTVKGGNKTRGSNGKLQHNCPIPNCGKVFRYPSGVKRHLNYHSSKKFVCAHCNKEFAHKDELSEHIGTHEINYSSDLLESTSDKPNSKALKGYLESPKMSNSNSRPLHLCHISYYKEFSYVKVRKRHLRWRKGKAKLICSHCDERFWRKNSLAEHVRRHMDFNETGPKNDDCSSQVVPSVEKKDNLSKMSSDNFVNTLNCETQPSLNDLLSPTLDFAVSKSNSVVEALTEENTDYSLDCFENCSPAEQIRVSIRELLLPLLSKSKVSSTCQPRYYLEDLSTVSRPLHSPENSMNGMLIFKGNNLQNCKSTDWSIDDGIETENSRNSPRYVCPIRECKKVYRHAGFFKGHLDWHNGKKNFICAHCDKEFMTKCAMACHVRVHMNQYQELNREIYNKSTIISHTPDRASDINFNERLEKQLRWHGNRIIFVCPLCGLEFPCKDKLTEHVEVHIIGQQNQWSIKSDNRTKSPGVKLQQVSHIPNCRKVFKCDKRLKKQMQWHENRKIFVCPLCDLTFPGKDILSEHVKMHVIGQQNQSENRSFDIQISQNVSISEAEAMSADYTTDSWNCETQFSLQDLIPLSLDNYVSGCYSIIKESTEVKTENFLDDLTNMTNFSSFRQNYQTEDPSLICKTEYFVQESIASSLNDQVSDCYPIMDELPEIKTENFEDTLVSTTSSSSLVRNPFHRQFLRPLPLHKKKMHPDVKLSLPLSKTETCTKYLEQESMPPSPNSQVSSVDPIIERSLKITTNNFVDNLGMTSTSSFEQNQSRRQNSPSPPLCQKEVQILGCNSSLKTMLLETNAGSNVDDETYLTNALSQKQSDIQKQPSSPTKSNSLLNILSVCKNRSKKQDSLPLTERKFTLGLDNLLISEAESRSIKEDNKTKNLKRISSNRGHLKKWPSVKNVFSCKRCDKKFAYLSEDKHIAQCPKCNAGDDKEMGNSNDKAKHNYSCSRCKKVFDAVATLSRHLDEHKNQENSSSGHSVEPVAIVNTNIEREELNNNNIESDVSQISCIPKLQVLRERKRTNYCADKLQHPCHIPNCGQVYNNPWHLKRHLEWHSGKKTYFCFHCNKGFVHKDVYIFHLSKAHLSGDKRIAQYANCSADDGDEMKNSNDKTNGSEKVFESVVTLSKHLDELNGQEISSDAHRNVEPSELNGNIIKKQASQIFSLPKLHVLEEGEQTICDAVVANKTVHSSVNPKHARRTPKIRRLYFCYYQICDKVFDSTIVLQKHLDEHIGQKNWLCIYCDKKFLYKYELKAHVKAHLTFSENYDIGHGPPANGNGTQLNNEVKVNNSIVSNPARKRSVNENSKDCSNYEDDCIWKADENNEGTRLYCNLTALEVLKRDHNYALPNLHVIPEHQVPNVCQETEIPADVRVDNKADDLTSVQYFPSSPLHFQDWECNSSVDIGSAHLNDIVANSMHDHIDQKHADKITQVNKFYECTQLKSSTFVPMKMSVDGCFDDNVEKNMNNRAIQLYSESMPLEASNEELEHISSKLRTMSCHEVSELCQKLKISSGVSKDHPADSLTCMKSISSAEEMKFDIQTPLKSDLSNVHPRLRNVPSPLPTFQLTNLSDSDRNGKKPNFSCMPLKKKFAYKHSLETSQSLLISGSQMAQKQIQTPCQCPNCSAENGNKIKNLNGKTLHVCHITGCNKVFVYPNALKKHLELHYRHKDFFCVYCDKGFTSEYMAMKHLDIHRNPKKGLPMLQELVPIEHQNPNCNTEDGNKNRGSDDGLLHAWHSTDFGIDFDPSTSLTKQPDGLAGEQIFVCPYCPGRFTSKAVFMEHIFLHATERQTRPYSPVSQSLSLSKSRITQKLEQKKSQCTSYSVKGGSDGNHVCPVPDCGKVFSKILSLRTHQIWHSRCRKYFCSDCKKGFYREDHLKAHVKFWQGLCLSTRVVETLQKNKLMDRHYPKNNAKSSKKIKGPSKTPPYFCPIPHCKRVYKHFGHFKAHQTWHQSQNKFFCAHCDEVFENKFYLARHIKTHTNTEQVRSNDNISDGPILQSYYSLKPEINAEIQSNVAEPQHICTVAECAKIYYSAENLSAHLESYHGDHSYRIPKNSKSHTSDIDSCNSECEDQYRFEASYLLDHQYSKSTE